jgi:hypothetical protein
VFRKYWQIPLVMARTTLPEVKKEMKGRYPKPPWPDNPWSAEATARPSRGSDEAQGRSLKKNVCTIDMPPGPAA